MLNNVCDVGDGGGNDDTPEVDTDNTLDKRVWHNV